MHKNLLPRPVFVFPVLSRSGGTRGILTPINTLLYHEDRGDPFPCCIMFFLYPSLEPYKVLNRIRFETIPHPDCNRSRIENDSVIFKSCKTYTNFVLYLII